MATPQPKSRPMNATTFSPTAEPENRPELPIQRGTGDPATHPNGLLPLAFSLFAWVVLLGANATMALWLLGHNGGHFNHAVFVSAVNALMCGAIAAAIVWHRWGTFVR